MTWEEDFLEDSARLLEWNSIAVGSIRRVGGSWECKFGNEVIAIRPDKNSAMVCVSQYHDAVKKEKT